MAVSRHTEKDIGNYEAKLIGPFTSRQCIFLAIGIVPSVLACFIIHGVTNDPYAMFFVVALLMTPACFFAFGQKICHGMKPENFLVEYYYYHIKCAKKRLYRTETLDDIIETKKQKELLRKTTDKKKQKELEEQFSEGQMKTYPHKENSSIRSFL